MAVAPCTRCRKVTTGVQIRRVHDPDGVLTDYPWVICARCAGLASHESNMARSRRGAYRLMSWRPYPRNGAQPT